MNITRSAIKQRLLEVGEYPLTVMTAPIGYGKSTAVRTISKQVEGVIEWYDDRQERWYPKVCYEQYTWVVLEHYEQYLEDEGYRKELLEIVYQQREHLHILLLSRAVPQLPLEALALKGICQVIKAEELRFGEAEIKACFEVLGIQMEPCKIQALEAYVQGWPAAILMMGKHYKKYKGSYDQNSLYALLYNEIYKNYDQAYQKLLLFLGEIGEFSLSEFEEMEQYRLIRGAVEQLLSQNILIAYDPVANRYKLMPLFRQFLQNQSKLLEVDEYQFFFNYIAEWYINKQEWEKVFQYLMQVRDYPKILGYLAQEEGSCLNDMVFEEMATLIEKIELSELQKYPIAHLRLIFYRLQFMPRGIRADWLEELEVKYEGVEGLDEEMYKRIKGELHIFRGCRVAEDTQTMWGYFQQAMVYIPKGSIILRGIDYIDRGRVYNAYLYHTQIGKYYEETCEMKKRIKAYRNHANSYSVEVQYLLSAEYAMYTGDWVKARNSARKAFCAADMIGCYRLRIWSHLLLAHIALGEENDALCEKELQMIQKDEVYNADPQAREIKQVGLRYIRSVWGKDISDIEELEVDKILVSKGSEEDYISVYLANSTYFLRKKEYIRLEVLVDVMGERVLNGNQIFGQIYYYIFKAILAAYHKQESEAIQAIQKALALAEPDGIILPFREFAKDLAPILGRVKCQDTVEPSQPSEQGLENWWGLTEREWQIAQLIQQGLTNKEIANQLCVAYVTIAKTTSNIYKKMGVNNRIEMVTKLTVG